MNYVYRENEMSPDAGLAYLHVQAVDIVREHGGLLPGSLAFPHCPALFGMTGRAWREAMTERRLRERPPAGR